MTNHTPSTEEREKLENDLLEVVAQLPFLERGRTLNPSMYPALVNFILADRQSTAKASEEAVIAAQLRGAIDHLKELARNGHYTSSAKSVDYVPLFRLEDTIAVLEDRLRKALSLDQQPDIDDLVRDNIDDLF